MKQIRKILTFALILFFTVTNTGLPLIKHVCQMMETTSLEACDMCKVEEESNCCEEDNFEVSFTDNQFSDCCQSDIVLKPISDKFISQKANLENQFAPVHNFFSLTGLDDYSFTEIKTYSSDKSPPFLLDNHLYLINSIFLI
ncbi:MAG: hypothetical protein FJ213_10535 [Ignavibacteria bacterium]|nr:hypothetical protein [Ignavibacteria bacterium]